MSTDHAVEQRPTISRVIKRSIIRNGHRSTVSLEDQFWDCLREIAKSKKLTAARLVEQIDRQHTGDNLSSAIRVFVLEYYQKWRSQNSEHK
jgi:predicted DNA-binding ribbon-helix-helix protein